MNKKFLDVVHQGNNAWWLYARVILIIVLYWWGFSGYTFIISQIIFSSIFDSTISTFIATFIPFIFVLSILAFSVKRLHNRECYSLINPDISINIKRLFLGFGIWGGQLFIFTFLDMWIHPKDYIYTFELYPWLLLLAFSLILIPIQTSTEELLYRGYLAQGLSLITKHPLVLILVTSLAFAVPHFGNPEMQRGATWGALTYFAWGVFLAIITLKDQGLELALGVHCAHNLFLSLIINAPDSAVSTPALFSFTRYIDPKAGFLSLLIQAGFFYAIFFGGIPRESRPRVMFLRRK